MQKCWLWYRKKKSKLIILKKNLSIFNSYHPSVLKVRIKKKSSIGKPIRDRWGYSHVCTQQEQSWFCCCSGLIHILLSCAKTLGVMEAVVDFHGQLFTAEWQLTGWDQQVSDWRTKPQSSDSISWGSLFHSTYSISSSNLHFCISSRNLIWVACRAVNYLSCTAAF